MGKIKLDLLGKKFGRLVVIGFDGVRNRNAYWKCKCECGNEVLVLRSNLVGDLTHSCGCLFKETISKVNSTHGETKNQKEDGIGYFYNCWRSIKRRCKNTKAHNYKYYGGRGITYDIEWEKFENFKKDMYKKYLCSIKKYGSNSKLSIERKDVDGNYCKENCIFIPLDMQSKNRRKTKYQKWFKAVDPNGVDYYSCNKVRFGKEHNLCPTNILDCIKNKIISHKGWRFYNINFKKLNWSL
ncbi:MAG: hypothetical protein RBR32_03585 [Bacteroidales bacterium]|nr:hypothetical protein [Bacteroidales bacterium]